MSFRKCSGQGNQKPSLYCS